MKQHEITLEKVSKSFNQGSKKTYVLKEISYNFVSGSSYAITGISGMGKSTLMTLIAGLDNPTSGAVFFDAHNLSSLKSSEKNAFLSRKIGILFQSPYLVRELSVLENVMMKGLFAGYSMDDAQSMAHNLLRLVGLEAYADAMPAVLSGGQQQRVALARALFGNPLFLLADEPTGNLDTKTSQEIGDLLINLHQNHGIGLIISTHDKSLAHRMQTILELKDGLLLEKL